MRLLQVVVHDGCKGAFAIGTPLRDALGEQLVAVAPGALHGLDQHGVARGEVRVEAAMGKAGLFHDVGHADAVIAAATDGTRSHLDDPVMGLGLALCAGSHDGRHITIIILKRQASTSAAGFLHYSATVNAQPGSISQNADIRYLGRLLGDVIRAYGGQALFERIESIRATSVDRYRGSSRASAPGDAAGSTGSG